MGKGIIDGTNLVNGAVWEYPVGSPVPDHHSWSWTIACRETKH